MKHLRAMSIPKKAAPELIRESKKCTKFGKNCLAE